MKSDGQCRHQATFQEGRGAADDQDTGERAAGGRGERSDGGKHIVAERGCWGGAREEGEGGEWRGGGSLVGTGCWGPGREGKGP